MLPGNNQGNIRTEELNSGGGEHPLKEGNVPQIGLSSAKSAYGRLAILVFSAYHDLEQSSSSPLFSFPFLVNHSDGTNG